MIVYKKLSSGENSIEIGVHPPLKVFIKGEPPAICNSTPFSVVGDTKEKLVLFTFAKTNPCFIPIAKWKSPTCLKLLYAPASPEVASCEALVKEVFIYNGCKSLSIGEGTAQA